MGLNARPPAASQPRPVHGRGRVGTRRGPLIDRRAVGDAAGEGWRAHTTAARTWRDALPPGLRPYTESAPIAAFMLGVSSGFPYAMIGATLTTRLAQAGIQKSTVTAFTLAFLAYNLKFLWAWVVDGVRIPVLGRLGQRVSWLILAGLLVMAAVANLGLQDPSADVGRTAMAAILVAVAGATFDIVIDGYRIELLEPRQLGVGSRSEERRVGKECRRRCSALCY